MLESIRHLVEKRIGSHRYRTWFGDGALFQLDDERRLDVVVANHFIGNWVRNNYLDQIAAAAREVMGEESVDIRIIDQPRQGPGDAENPARAAGESAHTAVGVERRPRRPALRGTLESFIVGPGNRLAHAAASQMVDAPGLTCRLLVVHGGCGLGKTHLLHGVCNGVRAAHPALEWRYVSGEEFTNQFVYAVRTKRVESFRVRFRHVDILAIDDLHFLADKKATQAEFLHTFNAIEAAGKAVVISSDRHPRSIATFSEPLADRLIAGMVVEVKPPDFATRCLILRRRAVEFGREVGDDVVEFVAHHVTRNVRELEGALYKLIALSSLDGGKLTVELARRALGDIIAHQNQQPRVGEVQRRVAERFCVRPERIATRSRDRTVALARAVIMYLLRRHTDLSYLQIVRGLGHKNHTTAVMACRRIQELLQQDAAVRWKTPMGPEQAPVRVVIADLECELFASSA
jgi:chromosomal replication initiator protein